MTWDLKDLSRVDWKTFSPEGHLVITSRAIGAIGLRSEDPNGVRIPPGEILMLAGPFQKNSWGQVYIKAFYKEKLVTPVSIASLILVKPKNKLRKQSFAVTGNLLRMREFYKTLIKVKGGIFKNQVSNNTDNLVVGHSTKETTKYKKAVRLGKRMLSEKQLMDLLQSQ